MLPSTAQRLLAAASLSSSGQGNVPTGILREGQAAELQAGAPGQVIAAFLCLWESNFIPPTPLKRKIYRINIYIFLSCCLKCWLSDCSIIFLTSHSLLRKLFRWVSSRYLNTLKAEKYLEAKKGREREREPFLIMPKHHILERWWHLQHLQPFVPLKI